MPDHHRRGPRVRDEAFRDDDYYGDGAERWRRMHADRRYEGPAGYNDSGPVQGGWTYEDEPRNGQRDYPYGPSTPYGYRGRGEYDGRGRGGQGARGPRPAHEDRSWLEKAGERTAEWFGQGEHRGRGPAGYRRSDERIGEDVHDRLTDDSWLDASAISVEVKDSEVTLSGTVSSREAKHRAEHIVEAVSGVGHVQNNLRVSASDSPAAWPQGADAP